MIGLVLAGGKSSRFEKGDKALYFDPYYQKTWVEIAVSTLLEVTSEVYVSVNTQNIDPLRQILSNQPVSLIMDHPELTNQGPLSGLYTICSMRPEASILVSSVDYPELTATSLRTLAANPNCYAIDGQGNSHFTIGHFSFELSILEDYLATGQRNVRSFLELLSAVPVVLPDEQLINHNQK
ncbi:molybdenum cofactor guanylyltransferase [Enterococcus sp. AZ109]|uniref:molybdenum cofactor guanylyltransferase n=1 Tax=Enterococcus sp. AZ109 TaxID=2774634 RepID=UPI003F2447D1